MAAPVHPAGPPHHERQTLADVIADLLEDGAYLITLLSGAALIVAILVLTFVV